MRALLLLCSLSLGCSGSLLRPVVATDAATGLEQVTHGSGNETNPAVSPDAKAVAYEIDKRVQVRSLVGTGTVIYDASVAGSQPTWMPDATSIVFKSGAKVVQTFGQGVRPVFLADVGDPLMMETAARPAVSPDGNLVALSLNDVTVRKSGRAIRGYDQALAITDLVGSNIKVIGRGTDPAFSPDGKRLALVKTHDGHRHVYLANSDGSYPVQLTDGANDDETPTFSPDGRTIAFCSVPEGKTGLQANLFEVRTDGSGLVQLTEGDRYVCHPSWGRDGFIYFHANADQHFHIWRLRPRTI